MKIALVGATGNIGREIARQALERGHQVTAIVRRDSGLPAEAEQWAAGISGPAYAIDDQTAIKVVNGAVEVVSEGHWKLLT